MSYVGLLIVTAMLGAVDLPRLWRTGERREAWIVAGILLMGVALSLALLMHLPMPTVSKVLQWLFPPLVTG